MKTWPILIPLLSLIPLPVSADPSCRWVGARDGQVPARALVGGHERDGTPLYVCRAAAHGGLHPGKVVGEHCNIAYGGKEELHTRYEVLTGCRGAWKRFRPGSAGRDRAGAPGRAGLVAGREADGTPLVLCRARHRAAVKRCSLGQHPGKVVAGSCNFSYGGEEIVQGPGRRGGDGFEYFAVRDPR